MKKVLEEKIGIPMGMSLRLLLNSEHVSPGEINNLLKGKGIFIGNADKSRTVPLLASMILTPDDYKQLVEACIGRELRLKNKTVTFRLTAKDIEWTKPICDHLEERIAEIVRKFEDVEFINKPTVEVDGPDTVRVRYVVRRKDVSKEWVERELDFQAMLEFTRVGDEVDLKLYSSHTSKETEAINRSMTQVAAKLLHEAKVTTSESPQQIRFDTFDNKERVRFFKKLISGRPPFLGVGGVSSIEINLDPANVSLPNDPQISWMQGMVKRIEIDGEKMNNIFLISDEKYYEYYHIQNMHVSYPFKDGTNAGQCRVTFSFSGPNRNEEEGKKRELAHVRSTVEFELKPNADARAAVIKKIDGALRELVDATFQQVLVERAAAAAASAAGKPGKKGPTVSKRDTA